MSKRMDQEILDAVEITVQSYMNKAPFLIMKDAFVVSVLGNGLYTVKIDSVDSNASSISSTVFAVGNTVKVIYSNSNQEDKIIIGKKGG